LANLSRELVEKRFGQEGGGLYYLFGKGVCLRNTLKPKRVWRGKRSHKKKKEREKKRGR